MKIRDALVLAAVFVAVFGALYACTAIYLEVAGGTP